MLRDLADRFASPFFLWSKQNTLVRVQVCRFGVVLQGSLQIAFGLHHKSQAVEKKRILRIALEGLFEHPLGFEDPSFLKQRHGLEVRLISLVNGRLRRLERHVYRLSLQSFPAGFVDYGLGAGVGGKLVIFQSAVNVTFNLGDITEVIQSKRVVRIKEIGLYEMLFGFFDVSTLQFFNTVTVQLLDRGSASLCRQRQSKIAPLGRAGHSGKKANEYDLNDPYCHAHRPGVIKFHRSAALMLSQGRAFGRSQ